MIRPLLIGLTVGVLGALAAMAGWTAHAYRRHVLHRKGWK
jgi:hypothetical protein